ncbi:MAG: hypothetical protein JSV30_03000 [Candidatus Omnitrophota bacterium]|nr:MAG: hypothetical protein JSV30_03000 [Candidatus Omnitrophota bacterium]
MLKERIIEITGRRKNKDLPFWYKDKVLELSGFLLKKLKEENMPVESNNVFESQKLEVILK